MSNKEFEKVVLEKLNFITSDIKIIKEDVSGLKEDVSGLKEDVSGLKEDVSGLGKKIDRLDDKVDDQTLELKQTIRQQGAYIDQAFNRITDIQNIQYKIQYTK